MDGRDSAKSKAVSSNSSSIPNGAGLPPIRMAPPCASASGLTLMATGAFRCRLVAMYPIRCSSSIDSAWISPTPSVSAKWSAAGFPGLIQCSGRSDFQTRSLRQKERQDIQVGICLDRIVDLESRRERRAQQVPLLPHERFVVGEQRSAESLGELADGNAADLQLALRADKGTFDTGCQLHAG